MHGLAARVMCSVQRTMCYTSTGSTFIFYFSKRESSSFRVITYACTRMYVPHITLTLTPSSLSSPRSLGHLYSQYTQPSLIEGLKLEQTLTVVGPVVPLLSTSTQANANACQQPTGPAPTCKFQGSNSQGTHTPDSSRTQAQKPRESGRGGREGKSRLPVHSWTKLGQDSSGP
ncbi:hypothetical protein CPB84DRAFT_1522880 [Gymnopilus junonius]|uniref:Uncharacterized protein n=1 Tax=Gymnopilus junonius TaxID=109634 RepID=A0A9P5NJH8_GYMJU|nr:hypothetical protein CPB84DRAFT_1522880 [Gymnopilus junonius]